MSNESVRVDKWLWAVRLFKTRSRATRECGEGHIARIEAARVALKPASPIRVGDHLEIPQPDGSPRHLKRTIEVVQLLEKRAGAAIARDAYRDLTPDEVQKAAREGRMERILQRRLRKEGDQGRMTKKQRRDWEESTDE